MGLPGSRTLRGLVGQGLLPLRALSDRTGLAEAVGGLRRLSRRAYIARAASRRMGRNDPVADAEWARLCNELSDASGYFFCENLVSNETELLAAAPALEAMPPGLACLGVGPEPILTYLGLVDTPRAFVVDIRRDNLRLHWLYRALFALARSRAEWLTLLLGRAYHDAEDPGSAANLDAVLAFAARSEATEASFRRAHERVLTRLKELPPHQLPGDRARMRRIHQRFWSLGPDITFQLEGWRLRRYPSLATLLAARAPDGRQLGFLANESTFRRVQRLELASGVIPLVGDWGGGDALRGVRDELLRCGLEIGVIYVSNVEQYLFEGGGWNGWVEALAGLPRHREAILIRSYFADRRGVLPDPPKTLAAQLLRTATIAAKVYASAGPLPLHQMRTVVHRVDAFLERERRQPYRTFAELVSDRGVAWQGNVPS